MKTKNILYIIVGFIVAFAILRQCEGETKTVTKTVTKIVTKHDTINNTIIKEVPKTVYVERLKTVKGKDSIVYKDKPNDSTITANQYDTELISNKATANLKITTTGELLDVQGVIIYPEKETITETIKTRNASGLYLYGNTSTNSFSSTELGLMFQFKNKGGLMVGAEYNNITNSANIKVGALIKIL